MAKWITLKDPDGKKGVRYREHPKRKHRVKKHGSVPDRFYSLSYWWQGKTITEGIGRASEGWTPTKCFDLLAELRRNQKTGQGPCTLAERREQDDIKKTETEKARIAEEKKNVSFKVFFDTIFYPDLKMRVKRSTYEKPEQHLKTWIDPVTGDIPMCELGIEHINKIISRLNAKKRTPRTQQYVMRTFAMVWNSALDYGIVKDRCPTKMQSFRLPKIDNEKQRYLTFQEEENLFSELLKKNKQVYEMALVSLDTGLRFGEVAALTWRCVDLDKGTLLVMNTKGKTDRSVPMTERLGEMFNKMIRGLPGDLVFPNSFGEIQKQIPTAFKRAVERKGLNQNVTDKKFRATFHTLRHTYASRLVQSGVDLYRVQRLLGHSTPVMTARYSKLADSDLRAAVNAMEKNRVEPPPAKSGKVIQLFQKKK